MPLKKLFTTSYGEKTYKYAADLQKMKVKTSIAKNQLIMKDCSKIFVVLAKNNAKKIMYSSLKKVEEIKLNLENILSEEHYMLIHNVTDNSREKEFSKKKKQLIDKYNNLSSGQILSM